MCFEAAEEFIRKRDTCTGDHHCGHYSSAMRTDVRAAHEAPEPTIPGNIFIFSKYQTFKLFLSKKVNHDVLQMKTSVMVTGQLLYLSILALAPLL